MQNKGLQPLVLVYCVVNCVKAFSTHYTYGLIIVQNFRFPLSVAVEIVRR